MSPPLPFSTPTPASSPPATTVLNRCPRGLGRGRNGFFSGIWVMEQVKAPLGPPAYSGGLWPLPHLKTAQSQVLRRFQWNRSSHSWSSDGSAPALTLCPFPACGRPVRTELGAPNSRAAGALFLPPGIRPPRDPPRIPPVGPLDR